MNPFARLWAYFLIFFLGIFISTPLFAITPKKCSIDVLNDLIEEHKAGFLSEEDSKKIGKLYDSIDLTNQEKALKTFEIVLAARLKSIPQNDAEIIRIAFQNFKTKPNKKIYGSFNYFKKQNPIKVEIPEQYIGTAVEYLIVIHEFEHYLQKLAIKRSEVKFPIFEAVIRSTSYRFLQEEGAMRAEWQYLNSIPIEVKQKITEELIRDLTLKNHDKDILIRNLLASPNNADTYLSIQWHAHRSSRDDIASDMVPVQALFFTASSLLGIKLILGAAYANCVAKIDEFGNFPDSLFFNKICLKLSPINNLIDIRKSKN